MWCRRTALEYPLSHSSPDLRKLSYFHPAPEFARTLYYAVRRITTLGLSLVCASSCYIIAAPGCLADDNDGDIDRTAAKAERGNFQPDFKKRNKEERAERREYRIDRPRLRGVDDSRAADDAGDSDSDERMKGTDDQTDKSGLTDSSDNRFDGSEFNAPSFQDADFGRHSFIDLLLKSPPKAKKKELYADDDHRPDNDKGKDKDDHDAITIHEEARRKKEKLADKHAYEELMELLASPEVSPNDWVPDKLDPLNNGGFTTSPDNGSPVPYRLNGHVDLERDSPWKKN